MSVEERYHLVQKLSGSRRGTIGYRCHDGAEGHIVRSIHILDGRESAHHTNEAFESGYNLLERDKETRAVGVVAREASRP